MNLESKEFHTVEYNSLREENLSHQARQGVSLIYSIAANGAVLAWLSSSVKTPGEIGGFVILGAWIPCMVSLIGLVFYLQATRDIHKIAEYCAILEQKFGNRELGWENWLISKRVGRIRFSAEHLYYFVFIVQLALSLWVGLEVMAMAPR